MVVVSSVCNSSREFALAKANGWSWARSNRTWLQGRVANQAPIFRPPACKNACRLSATGGWVCMRQKTGWGAAPRPRLPRPGAQGNGHRGALFLERCAHARQQIQREKWRVTGHRQEQAVGGLCLPQAGKKTQQRAGKLWQTQVSLVGPNGHAPPGVNLGVAVGIDGDAVRCNRCLLAQPLRCMLRQRLAAKRLQALVCTPMRLPWPPAKTRAHTRSRGASCCIDQPPM